MTDDERCVTCGATVSKYKFWHNLGHKFRGNKKYSPTEDIADFTPSFLDRSYISSLVGSKQLECSDFAIPVYLDTEALYGIWGAITGGFSLVEQRTITSSKEETTQASIAGEAGVNVSLVRLGMSASKSAEKTIGDEVERSLNLYQTNEALFNLLRLALRARLLKKLEDYTWDQILPADFVELRGIFEPTVYGMPNSVLYEILLTGRPKEGDARKQYKAAATLDSKYARDPRLIEICYKEFCLLGKVSRKSSESGLHLKGPRFDVEDGEVFRPRAGTNTIAGSVVEVVPIAVYV
jgi:hypothetical protein